MKKLLAETSVSKRWNSDQCVLGNISMQNIETQRVGARSNVSTTFQPYCGHKC